VAQSHEDALRVALPIAAGVQTLQAAQPPRHLYCYRVCYRVSQAQSCVLR
jgi:hypothetical protein